MLNELHLKTKHFWVTKIELNCVTEVTRVTGIRPDEAIAAYNGGKLNFPWPTENLTFAPRMRMLKWRPSPSNYDLDITNILVVFPQVRYIEVFDITNPRFNEQIWPVPSDFVKSRFHCNVLKKKGEASLLDQTAPTEIKSFPTEGYSTILSKMPKVTFGTVWKLIIDSTEWKRQLSTVKSLVKDYNFFMSKHVLSAYHQNKDAKHFIKSQVLPSMKKKMVYTCYIRLSSLGYVVSAKCGCPAGVDGRCNHGHRIFFVKKCLSACNKT